VEENSLHLNGCVRIEIELVDGGVGDGSFASGGIDYKSRTRVDVLGGS
jgi:hypothetical protein